MDTAANSPKKKKILLLMLEFPTWDRARAWAYSSVFGVVEGLEANNVAVTVLPYFDRATNLSEAYVENLMRLVGNQTFDQVWLYLTHCAYSPKFTEWLKEIAPIRVGIAGESLEYEPYVIQEYAHLGLYKQHAVDLMKQLDLTHVIHGDENDITISRSLGIKSTFLPIYIPKRFIQSYSPQAEEMKAAFAGTIYSQERQRLMTDPKLGSVLARVEPPEQRTDYPSLFTALNRNFVLSIHQLGAEDLHTYLQNLQQVRSGIFEIWLQELSRWACVFNPPSYYGAYPGRVLEAMSIGRPVLTTKVKNRPQTAGFFEDQKDIVFYDKNNIPEIYNSLSGLLADDSLRTTISDAARAKALKYHTAEVRMQQYLDWIDSNIDPQFDGGQSSAHDAVSDLLVF